MPTDPKHGRRIPSGSRFARALAVLLRQSFADSRQLIELGYRPGLGELREQIGRLAFQTLGVEYVAGYLRTIRRVNGARLRVRLDHRHTARGILRRGYGLKGKALGNTPPNPPPGVAGAAGSLPPGNRVLIDWTLFRPEVRIAAENAALRLAGTIVDDTRRMIRDELATGLQHGEPVAAIAERIRLTGFSPKRATTIAQTESSRAMHAGQAVAARELGVTQWTWLASSDACPICLELDGKTVDIGAPFYVWPKGNPAYRVVYHAPAHPHCYCTNTEEMPE